MQSIEDSTLFDWFLDLTIRKNQIIYCEICFHSNYHIRMQFYHGFVFILTVILNESLVAIMAAVEKGRKRMRLHHSRRWLLSSHLPQYSHVDTLCCALFVFCCPYLLRKHTIWHCYVGSLHSFRSLFAAVAPAVTVSNSATHFVGFHIDLVLINCFGRDNYLWSQIIHSNCVSKWIIFKERSILSLREFIQYHLRWMASFRHHLLK